MGGENRTGSLIECIREDIETIETVKRLWQQLQTANEENEKLREALNRIAEHKVVRNMTCRTDMCKNSIGICYECQLQKARVIAQQALGGQ